MADQERRLEPQDAAHLRLMRSILQGAAETPLLLKGGTALLMGYGLDRFSEDLDFDASHKVNLLRVVERRMPPGFTIQMLDTPKNTDTVTRHRLLYSSPDGQRKLKLEVSYRSPPSDAEVRTFDSLRVASIARIAHQKLLAAHDGDRPRSKIRDLYDLDFIARSYPAAFTDSLIDRFRSFASNPDDLVSRFRPDFDEDDMVPDLVDLESLTTRICCHADDLHDTATEVRWRIDQMPTMKERTGAAYTLWENAVAAISHAERAGGSAAEVNWHAVNHAVIVEAIGENGQSAETVADVLCMHSPAAASRSQQAEWRSVTSARAPELETHFAAKDATSTTASRHGLAPRANVP